MNARYVSGLPRPRFEPRQLANTLVARITLLLAVACVALPERAAEAIEILREGHHVWGQAGAFGFSGTWVEDSYDLYATDSVSGGVWLQGTPFGTSSSASAGSHSVRADVTGGLGDFAIAEAESQYVFTSSVAGIRLDFTGRYDTAGCFPGESVSRCSIEDLTTGQTLYSKTWQQALSGPITGSVSESSLMSLNPFHEYALHLSAYSFLGDGSRSTTLSVSMSAGSDGGSILVIPERSFNCVGEVPIALTNWMPVCGLSLGIVHDPAVACLARIDPGSAWQAAGLVPDVWIWNLDPALCEGSSAGGTLAATVSLEMPLDTLPPSDSQEVARFVYRASSSGECPLRFVDCLGDPAVATRLSLLLGDTPTSVTPLTTDGALRVTGLCFKRGDADDTGSLDINDPVVILYYLFAGRELSCLRAADTDDDGVIDIVDCIYLLDYLFRGATAPPAPLSECGGDDTPDELSCAVYSHCDSCP